jgi:DNA-binding response OmpR family regulator
MKDIASPALLWIDDEITRDSAVVQLLEHEGYKVDCAVSGTAGLAMARTGEYQGILLDLRLPDIPGLTVLATLRADAINAPVLVLTGFGDTGSAFAARHFGADGFKCKPLLGDELSTAVRQTLQRAQPVVDAPVGDVLSPQERAHYPSVAALLERLHRLLRNQSTAVGYAAVDVRENVAMTLARALADSALPTRVFLACAAALRSTMRADTAPDPRHDLAIDATDTILETLALRAPSDSHVNAALHMVEDAAARHRRLKLEDVAGAMTERIRPERLGTLIQQQTGFWHTDWRTAFLIRPSMSLLLNTDDDVKQTRFFRQLSFLLFFCAATLTYQPRVRADSCLELMSQACAFQMYWWGYAFGCIYPASCDNMYDCCEDWCDGTPTDWECTENESGPYGHCICFY